MGFRSLVKAVVPRKLFVKIEPYGHLAEAVLINALNGFPWRGLKVIGVTGTNGKSTVCFLIHKMLTEAGYKVALMTTIAYGVGNDIKPQDEHMTTSSVPKMLARLKGLKKAHDFDWVVLETTSQGLAQHRVWGVPYSIAVMTNVTHEHLDYHKTFERYVEAKKLLFRMADKNKKGLRAGVINAEDPSAEKFAASIANPITYGKKTGDIRAKNIKMTPAGSEYAAEYQGVDYNIKTRLPGSFNVDNSLAAVGTGIAIGLNKEQIEQGIVALRDVEGRMNMIDEGQDFEVIVDYAHTPDSFEKLFKDLKPVIKGKLIVMFGSAGRRDEAKRPVQGELAGKYADEVVITEEDDRDIDGEEIMAEIAAGALKAGKIRDKDLFLIHDREQAIKFALERAGAGDTVLLLGKGHEKTIEGPDGERPWDEIAVARKTLRQRVKSNE